MDNRMDILQTRTFRTFMEKKYIAAYMSAESEKKFEAWLNERGIFRTVDFGGVGLADQQPFEFHCTIAFSTNEVMLTDVNSFMGDGIKVKPIGFKMLGVNQDVPVMELDPSGPLEVIRQSFIAQTGIQEAWPNWLPHISISYDKTPITLPTDLPDFDIYLDQFIVQSTSK